MADHVPTRAFSALRWGYAGFAARALSSFVTGVVLARLLGPKPFGQVAAATLVFGLANQLADGGFSSALVQSPKLDETDVRFAFTFQLMIGSGLTAVCAMVSPAIGLALHDPVVGDVVRVTSLLFLIQAFGQSSAALLKRHLAFRPLQTAQVVSFVAGYGVVGITAASLGAGVWSLVAAQLAQSLTFSAMVFAKAGHSLIPYWSRSSLRLAHFGTKVAGANILNWSISNLDNAFVARAFGSTALGLYSRAFNTVSTPAEAVISTWQQVLFASCSRLGDRAQARRRAYLASVSAISLIMFPLFWSIAACAPAVVAGLYGARWAEAAPLLTPLALAISVHSVMAMAGPMLAAGDQVRREVETQSLSLAAAIGAFAFCGRYGAVSIAWAVLFVYLFRLIVATQPALRLLNLRWNDVLRVSRGSILVGLATATMVWGVGRVAISHSLSPGQTLITLAVAGIASLFVFLSATANHVLSRELVIAIKPLSGSLPAVISRTIERINTKQASREDAAQVNLYCGDSLESTPL